MTVLDCHDLAALKAGSTLLELNASLLINIKRAVMQP